MTDGKKPDARSNEPFLSRWARVKQDAQARVAPAQVNVIAEASHNAELQNTSNDALSQPKMPGDALPERTSPVSGAKRELPSLDSLTPQSDFSAYMAKDVDPQLRNQAMKKLFTDPHYNVMDRLDTYIDDYSTHPPLPLDVIRQMSISKTLGLFDDEEEEQRKATAAAAAAPGMSAPVAEAMPAPAPLLPADSTPPQTPELDTETSSKPPLP